jgi:hypothetical protein
MPRFNLENYVDVQTRILRFWTEYPDGAIITKLMSPPDDFTQCRYEAQVFKSRDDTRPSATGYAFELAGKSERDGANFTSHEENGETSAIGRALANLGYATSRADRPSRQEMTKVANGNGHSPQAPTRVVDRNTGEVLIGDETLTWTDFWSKARPLGYQQRPQLERVLGRSIDNLTPSQVLALITPKEAAMADPDEARKEALKKIHAAMKEKGYDPPHAPLKLLAGALHTDWPDSLAQWDAAQLQDVTAYIGRTEKDTIDAIIDDAMREEG